MKRILMVSAALLATVAGCTQPATVATETPRDMMQAFTLAQTALRQGDAAGAASLLREADSLSPGHPTVLLVLARASAMAGDTTAAFDALERLLPTGTVRDLLADTALANLRGSPRLAQLAGELSAAAAPVMRSDTTLSVPDPDLIAESVTYDPRTGTFLVGSMFRRTIVRAQPASEPSDLLDAAQDGLGAVLGMRVDSARQLLWVANWVRDSLAPKGRQGDAGWAQLDVYDLRTRQRVRRIVPRDTASAHLLNDLVLTREGDAYVTDSEAGLVHRVRSGADSLELLYRGTTGFGYPNGIALSADERRLYVAHVEGLTVINTLDGRATRVRTDGAAFVGGIDGLYACGESLVGVQAALDHYRIVRIHLAPGGDSVSRGEVLERRHPAMDIPTTGVLVGDTLHYIANSGLNRLQPDGTLAPAPSVPTVLLRLPLGGCLLRSTPPTA